MYRYHSIRNLNVSDAADCHVIAMHMTTSTMRLIDDQQLLILPLTV